MTTIARSLLAAGFVAGLTGAAAAQGYVYDEPLSEPLVEWSGPAQSAPYRYASDDRSARVRRVATPYAPMRVYAAPAMVPATAQAITLPTRVVYAEPAPRVVYYNEPTIIDGLRVHRAATRVHRQPCGYGCVRSAY